MTMMSEMCVKKVPALAAKSTLAEIAWIAWDFLGEILCKKFF
jgi:hypothetical protein